MTENTAPAEHEPTCTACQVVMELGYLPHYVHGGLMESMWHRGKPISDFWRGLYSPRPQPITAYRCPKCSRLELFAFARVWKKVE